MSEFPSGIPDPQFFTKLGPKDRSRIRQNIEANFEKTHKADNMANEQTYEFN
jgi:nucleoside-diphosphate kinase